MAKEKDATQSSAKKNDKSLPGLIFLIGLALIIGGILMQVGYFDTSGSNPTPESSNSNTSSDNNSDESDDVAEADSETLSGGENIDDVDFSNTTLKDNESLPVKKNVEYTYGTDFKMTVTDLEVTCDGSGTCGSSGDKVTLKYVTNAGQEFPLTLTPSENTKNLVDVPVSVEEWHDGYVVILMTRAG